MTVSAAYVTAGVIAAALLITWYSKPRRGLQLPPGPKGLPILGNLFDMPNGKDWIAYQRLAQTYGTSSVIGAVDQPHDGQHL